MPLQLVKNLVRLLSLGLFLMLASALAQQYPGKVIDRNGAPQAGCQITFSGGPNQAPIYRATSARDGSFYVVNVRPGPYYVVVRYGQQQFAVPVTINASGLQPSTLIATW